MIEDKNIEIQRKQKSYQPTNKLGQSRVIEKVLTGNIEAQVQVTQI